MTRWNASRFDPSLARGHVESHFLKLNEPGGRRALWLKATILRPVDGEALAEGWAIAFDREVRHAALKESVPATRARLSREEMDLVFGNVCFAPDRTGGSLRAGGRVLEWDLRFEGEVEPFAALPARLYDERLPTGKLVTPHPDLRFQGHYALDDERVAVDGWRGMQGHNWGRRHPHAYGWGHCNVWEDGSGLVFEGITARVKLGPWPSPPLTLLMVEHAGERHLFTLPRSLRRARGEVELRSWRFAAESRRARVAGRLCAQTRDLVGLRYADPDGSTLYCLNSKLARAELRLEVEGRAPVEVVSRAAALEIGTRDPAHGVELLA